MPHTIFATPLEFAVTCLVLLAAQVVYVLFGFGSGLIAVGTLALVFPEFKDVVVLLLLVNLPAELWVCGQSRRHIRWRPIAVLGTGIALGIPLGAYILRVSNPGIVLVVLGWFLMAVGVIFLRLPGGGKFQPPGLGRPPHGSAERPADRAVRHRRAAPDHLVPPGCRRQGGLPRQTS